MFAMFAMFANFVTNPCFVLYKDALSRQDLADSGQAASKLFTAKSGHSAYCNLAER